MPKIDLASIKTDTATNYPPPHNKVVEGRSRESIFRDGRWWDELAMSVLESDWRAAHGLDPVVPSPPVAVAAAGDPSADERVAVGTSDRLRRTLERWR